MHYLIINQKELITSKATVQSGVNRPTIVSVDVIISHEDNIRINLKDKAKFIYKNTEIKLIVINVETTKSNDKATIKIKLSEPLYLSHFSGGFYLYSGNTIDILNKLLNKYHYNCLDANTTNKAVATVVQLPYESDHDLILRLANDMSVKFYLKNNCIYCVNELKYHILDELVLKIEVNNKHEILIHYHPETLRLYASRKLKFNGKFYYLKEQKIYISELGVIAGTLLLTNNIENGKMLNRNSVFVEGVVVKEIVPHVLYEVKIKLGDTIKASVLNYSDCDQQNSVNIRYIVGQNVLLTCSTSFDEIWMLGCIGSLHAKEYLPCEYKYNKLFFKKGIKIINDNKSIQLSVEDSLMRISMNNSSNNNFSYMSKKLEVSRFGSIKNKSEAYNVKAVEYVVNADEYIMNIEAILCMEAKEKEVFSKKITAMLNRAHYKYKELTIKSNNLQSKFVASYCVGESITVKCNSLKVSANTICLSNNSGEIFLQGNKVELFSNNLSLNAGLIQINGTVVGGVATKKGIQKIQENNLEEYNESFSNKDLDIVVQDELEEVLGKGKVSIVDGVKLTLDSKDYKISNNKITFKTSSILSDISMD